mgnify:FL=1
MCYVSISSLTQKGEIPVDSKKWLQIDPGTKVKTTKEDPSNADSWTKEAKKRRRWGVEGEVITHHGSHGLCYEVRHEDGTKGCYDPSELEVVVTRCAVHGSIEHMQSITGVCPGCGKP